MENKELKENETEKSIEKKGKLNIVIIIILLVLVIGMASYIIYDKIFSKNDKANNITNTIKNNVNDNNENAVDNSKTQVYTAGTGLIYYNPVADTKCEKNSTDCYAWYVLTPNDTENATNIELILNKNLGDTVACNENNGGMTTPCTTAQNYLETQTSNWSIKPRMISINDIASLLNIEIKDGNVGVQTLPEWLYSNGETLGTWNGGYWSDVNPYLVDALNGKYSGGNQFLKSTPTTSNVWGVRPIIEVKKEIIK